MKKLPKYKCYNCGCLNGIFTSYKISYSRPLIKLINNHSKYIKRQCNKCKADIKLLILECYLLDQPGYPLSYKLIDDKEDYTVCIQLMLEWYNMMLDDWYYDMDDQQFLKILKTTLPSWFPIQEFELLIKVT